jgi:hypothetical protein
MKKIYLLFYLSTFLLLLTGCYRNRARELPTAADTSAVEYVAPRIDTVALKQKRDSLLFLSKHHYTLNFNFVVTADSIRLLKGQPEEVLSEMQIDSFYVYKNQSLAVADIRILPADPADSVWVQLARDQITFGWIHESELLPNVDPDDPISRFITIFSDRHLIIFLVFLVVIAVTYLVRYSVKRNAKIVHFNDIDTPYPMAFALTVATSATLYSTIQLFSPELWRHFYFHPTLNPLMAPGLIAFFLVSVWAIIIVGLAAVDEVRKSLPFDEAVVYLFGLAGVCAVDYIVFSFTTLYYIGYPLLAAYFWFAIRRWRKSI